MSKKTKVTFSTKQKLEYAKLMVVKILELRDSGLSSIEISKVFNDEGEILLKAQSSWDEEKVNKIIRVFG